MSDARPKRDVIPEETAPETTEPTTQSRVSSPAGDAGVSGNRGFDPGHDREERPNPHDDEHAPSTAAQAGGLMAGMFFPTIIIFIIALAVIGYFVFTR